MFFAKRKYLNKDSSVKEVVTPFVDQYEQELNNWQIKNEETLSRCAEDWTNAIPAKNKMDYSKKSLFVQLPVSHYRWDPNNYPTPENGRTQYALNDPGECYGFIEG